ncbi:salicylic acid-binding protein 2-like isoform X1 [Tasmannia lanceolata]|uniref:salicylic acid-binding protein 2-like isoform X1 n=1 Tax=Tasmannia lanceolata TaxID=3420 RepID=UPI0040628379
MEKRHFVLVHGAGHGAWEWYKATGILTAAGHRVTTVDLAASGNNPKRLSDVSTFSEYSQPLIEMMDGLNSQDKVILVGHSFGGMSVALAMDRFPDKILLAVFVAAFMPDCTNLPSFVLDKYNEITPSEFFMDSEFGWAHGTDKHPTSISFGSKFLSSNLYQLSPLEDFALTRKLGRETSFFQEDLPKIPMFSRERFGSVARVYIICDQDKALTEDFQRWMIENNPVKEVKVIQGSDHMPMFSKPKELCSYLLEIAQT